MAGIGWLRDGVTITFNSLLIARLDKRMLLQPIARPRCSLQRAILKNKHPVGEFQAQFHHTGTFS